MVVLTSMLMWLPVAGPLPELRPSLAVQMIYLFGQSIIPTVPTGFWSLPRARSTGLTTCPTVCGACPPPMTSSWPAH